MFKIWIVFYKMIDEFYKIVRSDFKFFLESDKHEIKNFNIDIFPKTIECLPYNEMLEFSIQLVWKMERISLDLNLVTHVSISLYQSLDIISLMIFDISIGLQYVRHRGII